MRKRILSLLLVLCMMVTLLPASALAEEPDDLHGEDAASAADDQSGIVYSDAWLTITADSCLDESGGSYPVTLTRGGDVLNEAVFTVAVYDNSTNYDADYRILYNGEAVEKLDGATSVYDAFRDNGELTSGLAFELAITEALTDEELPESVAGVRAAAAFAQLDELGAKAAELTVTFAAGERTAALTIEVLDDAQPEYEETFFLAVLDGDGEAIETAQQVFAIADNDSPAPGVTVAFDCDGGMELTDEENTVELTLRRSGDLATTTLVTVYVDGEIYGQVDFTPWQEVQTFDAVVGGVYSLDGSVSGIEVIDSATPELTVADGADPELDAIPAEYAVIRTPRTATDTSWLPDWATGQKTTGEDAVIILGDTNNNLFKAGGNSTKGEVNFFSDKTNVHEISSSGTGSRLSTGTIYADSIASYDFTGVDSVTTTVNTTGVDGNADIFLGVASTGRDSKRITANGTYDLTYRLPGKCQDSRYVYYGTTDPDNSSGGINLFIPNGFKLNLRQYRFIIEDNADIVDPYVDYQDPYDLSGTITKVRALDYSGGTQPGHHVPQIDSSKAVQYMTINSKTYGANKTVDIAYICDSQYPARLVGYKLMDQSGSCSEVFPLTDDGSGSAGFIFDADFLKKYEEAYCYEVQSSLDNSVAWTFHIIPVYEKVSITSAKILASDAGYMTFDSTFDSDSTNSYIGDKWVLTGGVSGNTQLSGVWFQAMTNLSDVPVKQGISQTRYTANSNKFVVDIEYPRYYLQGVFSTDAARLLVFYANDAAKEYGKLETDLQQENEVVSPEQYVVGDYVSLVAQPNDGYVTRWKASGGEYYYGNVFYYKLDGNPDHNIVYVDFVEAGAAEGKQTTGTLSGTLKRAYVETRTGGSTAWVPMANTTVTVTSDKTYTAVTDADGNFSIADFAGVSGKSYSMSVLYDEAIGYSTFTYTPYSPMSIQMPQFATGVPFPANVTADVDGAGSTQNMLTLTGDGTLNATVRVYTPPKNYTISGVNFYFLDADLTASGVGASSARSYAAKYVKTDGDYQIWSVSITGAASLSSGMKLYAEVISDKVIYMNAPDGTYLQETTSISTGLVDSGYTLTTANREESFAVSYPVPETPSMQSAGGISLGDIEIPVLGKLDFSLSSKTGGFFTQRTDADGNTTLICGCSYLASFATGSVSEKLAAKRKTAKALAAQEEQDHLSSQPVGGANPSVTATSESKDKPSNWSFSPAFLFKYTFSPKSNGSGSYLSRFEAALGVDASYIRNIPFSFYGVPFYVCLSFTTEAYFDVQEEYAESQELTADDISSDLLTGESKSVAVFIAAPAMNFMARGGVGYNGFLSLYLMASVNSPFVFSIRPSVSAATNLTFSVGAGANLVVFDAQVNVSKTTGLIGNEELKKDLQTITGLAAQSLRSSAIADQLDTVTTDVEQLLNESTFAPMLRTGGMLRASAGKGTVASNVFKNTGVHLLRLSEDNILAFFLKDTAGSDSETLNYLTVAYAMSSDGGQTWGSMNYVSDNTGNPNTSLQFDIKLFELEDRTLVTWSEANFDEVLKNLSDVNIEHLTPAQISKFMNAMNLKGRFFNSTSGEPMGETFTIAENSTVACGALDAVQNGDMVYVYYQRNVFPYDETQGEITLADLMNTDRTIAMARANVNDTDHWTSTTVRATKNGAEQEYRITEVEPFVHDGVMGEILVIDRDGRLAEWNGSSWEASNEDRQLYLRTYDFDEDGTPRPSALMAITDPAVCAQSPQVVSNGSYLHLFWNQDGKVVYLTDFVATTDDNQAVQEGAYVVVDNATGVATEVAANRNRYYANDIASDDAHFNIGTTFSASMDADGHVLLSWVATDPASDMLTDEIYGVVLETVTNADVVSGEGLDGSADLYQLRAQGSPIALTDEDSIIGALDSTFLSDHDGNSSFLLAFSALNDSLRSEATAADIKAAQSVYQPELEITDLTAPAYPMPGSEMTVSVTVANNGLGTAEEVRVSAEGIGHGGETTIDSILPGRSATLELTVAVPKDFNADATLCVTVEAGGSSASETTDIRYGPYLQVKSMPEMTSLSGTTNYLTRTVVYNAGNAAGVPTLSYQVGLFASDAPATEYSYTATTAVSPGGAAVLSYVLENTPVTADETGMLTVMVDTGDDDLNAYQYVQDEMPKLAAAVRKSDLSGITEPDNPEQPERPVKPADGNSVDTETRKPTGITFTDVAPTSYYAVAVQWAVENKITFGTTQTTFSPEDGCTRAQAVTFLWRSAGCPEPTASKNPFTDVDTEAYYYKAVLWAVEHGITKGTGLSTFSPDEACTRGQIVTFLWRAADSPKPFAMKNPFTDVGALAYHYKAVLWAVENGITNGTGPTTFSPDEKCTRAQIVTFLYRYSQLTIDN